MSKNKASVLEDRISELSNREIKCLLIEFFELSMFLDIKCREKSKLMNELISITLDKYGAARERYYIKACYTIEEMLKLEALKRFKEFEFIFEDKFMKKKSIPHN